MIDTVMFDMGGTIENLYSGPRTEQRTAKAMHALLASRGVDTGLDADGLWRMVYAGKQRYTVYANATMRELKPEEIWADYCFAELPALREPVIALSEELAHLWEVTYFERSIRPNVHETLDALKALGLRLGVVSNTASLFQVFSTLEEYGIRGYFDNVTLSSVTGYRKPHPNIFRIAVLEMRADPICCAYVGDTITRDVDGPRKVGFARTFQIRSFLTDKRDSADDKKRCQPDYAISDLIEVSQIMRGLLEKG